MMLNLPNGGWTRGQTLKPKPKRIVIQELRIKGIAKEIIDDVLGEDCC